MDKALAPAPASQGFPSIVRRIAVVGIAGLIVGVLVGGLGGRLFMRIGGAVAPGPAQGATTEAGFTVGEITLGGTIGLLIFVGIPVAIVGAALYVVFEPWLGWTGRLRGVAFGLVLLAVGSAVSDVMNPDNVDFLLIGNEVLLIATIVLLFVAFGVAMDAVVRRLDRALPQAGVSGTPMRVLYGGIAAIGVVLAILLLPQAFFTTNFCDCDPPILASWSVLVATAGTLLSWLAHGDASRTGGIARVLGYGGLVGAVVFGGWRAITDAVQIVGG